MQEEIEDIDIQERVENFNKEMQPLLGKYELGLTSRVSISNDGRILSAPALISTREKKEEKTIERPELSE